MNDEKQIDPEPVTSELHFGMFAQFGALPMNTPVTKEELALLWKRTPISIDRAVERCELPRPAKLLGKDTWTIGTIVRHIEKRMAEAAEDAETLAASSLRR